MSEQARKRMTSDEFIAWAMEQPETCHYELVDGEVVAMAPEQSAHTLTKFHVARQMAAQVEAANLPCQVYPDGMSVEVDERTVYEPDALVRCGFRLPGDAIKLNDPLIVVGTILTRVVRDGPIQLDPPGITLTDCFPPGTD